MSFTSNCPFANYGTYRYYCNLKEKWCRDIPNYECDTKSNNMISRSDDFDDYAVYFNKFNKK